MGFRSYLSSYETVLIENKSVDLQRDIISTLTPAVFMSCLDFAFPIPAETSVDSKILLFAKFRSFTRNPFDFHDSHDFKISKRTCLTPYKFLLPGTISKASRIES